MRTPNASLRAKDRAVASARLELDGWGSSMVGKTLVSLVVAVCCLVFASTALAGGWAGSRYDKDDCTYDHATDMLFCEARFTEETFMTAILLGIPDSSCASGFRLVDRTGWLVTTYRGWGIFFGRVPVHHKEFVGDEDTFVETWRDYTDVSLGCSPSG